MFADEEQLAESLAKLNIDAEGTSAHRAELRRRMLAAFEQARARGDRPARRAGPGGLRSRIVNSRLAKVAAAGLAACVVGAVVVWSVTGTNGAALAAVRQRLQRARTARFKVTWYRDGKPEYTGQVKWREPGRMRWEAPGMIAIYHWDEGKFLVLMPEAKTAHSATVSDMENPYHRDWIADLKKMVGSDSAKDVGHKDVSGRKARGWRFEEDGWVCTVWADARSGDLLSAEFATGNIRMVFTDFVFNEALDDSLFSLTPPADYKLHTRSKWGRQDPGEKDVILLLRVWAMGSKDTFPDDLDVRKWARAAARADWKRLGIESRKQAREAQDAISRGFGFLFMADRQWTYAGKGVRLGEKDKAVFWYRAQEAGKYRVIYGDLSVREVGAEGLPRPRTRPATRPAASRQRE